MTLPLIKIALPLFTGYMLFLIISGKFRPFVRPQSLSARPSWLFGLWCGLATSAVMFLVLQMVNPLALPGIKAMLPSSAALLAMAILPGIFVCNWYRSLVIVVAAEAEDKRVAESDELDDEMHQAMKESQDQVPTRYDLDDTLQVESSIDDSDETLNLPLVMESSPGDGAIESEYDSAFEREYNRLFGVSQNTATNTGPDDCPGDGPDNNEVPELETTSASTDGANPVQLRWPSAETEYDHAFTVACNSANDYLAARARTLETVAATQIEVVNLAVENTDAAGPENFADESQVEIEQVSEQEVLQPETDPDEEQLPLPLESPENTALSFAAGDSAKTESLSAQEEYDNAFETARAQTFETLQALAQLPLSFDEEAGIREEIWINAYAKIDAITVDFQRSLAKAKSLTRTEQKLRVETETHLRVTRSALGKLESEVRRHKSVKAEELIELENALEEKIRIAAKAESALAREMKNRAELESDVLASKESEVAARRDARKNTAARAKVLATANKALAFARQTVDARTRAEAEITRLKQQVNIHQDTISSLIATLDSEKTKSREEVSFLSRQLLQKEIELEKKSLAGGTLTSRLVKKVARARPVT